MRTIQIHISRQEAEDLVDLLEKEPVRSTWRLELADQLRLEFGMAYRDGRTDAVMHQFKKLLEGVTNAAYNVGTAPGRNEYLNNAFNCAKNELTAFVAELTRTAAPDKPPHPPSP